MVYIAAKNLNRLDDNLILRIIFQEANVVTGYSLVEQEVYREMFEFRPLLVSCFDVLSEFSKLSTKASDFFPQFHVSGTDFCSYILLAETCEVSIQVFNFSHQIGREEICSDTCRSQFSLSATSYSHVGIEHTYDYSCDPSVD